MNKKVIELAYVRNKLACNMFDEEDEKLLDKIEHKISISNSPFKYIALNAIKNCKESIKDNELNIASQEIQLIHNFIFEDSTKWNSDYFYKVELLSYLEQVDNVARIKKLIFLLAEFQNTI